MDPTKQQYGGGAPYPGYQPQAQPGYPGQPGYSAGFGGYPSQTAGFANPGYPGGQPPMMGFTMPIRPDIPMEPKPDDATHFGGGGGNMDFTEKSIRRGFIRKVYSILMVQLLVTVGFIALFVYHSGVKKWMQSNPWFYIVAMVFFIGTVIAMSCCEGVRRKAPGNFIFLGLFTLAASVMGGAVASTYKEDSVLLAVGITTVICFALTVFSFQTKYDFTRLNGFLFVCFIVLIIFSFIMIFLPHITWLRKVMACLGALLFSAYLIHDTQLLMGGDHKYSISPEEYIFAALTLYLDIFNIFMYILSLVGER